MNFTSNMYKWVAWITVIDSGIAWKNIWIIAITHWNEPVWLSIFDYLVNTFEIWKKIRQWKIYLIANNIDAYSEYVKNWDIDTGRFIDHNMNRITNQEFIYWSVEFERFKTLEPIFDEVDIVIDIHSVSKWNDLIWITDKKYLNQSKKFFDVETLLVDDLWVQGCIIWYFLRKNKEAYWIECWNHIDTSGLKNGIHNVLNFLSYCWCIDHPIFKKHASLEIFEFFQEITPKTDAFKFLWDFIWFVHLDEEFSYAIDGDVSLLNTYWNQIYIWMAAKIPKKWDGAGFLFRKIET